MGLMRRSRSSGVLSPLHEQDSTPSRELVCTVYSLDPALATGVQLYLPFGVINTLRIEGLELEGLSCQEPGLHIAGHVYPAEQAVAVVQEALDCRHPLQKCELLGLERPPAGGISLIDGDDLGQHLIGDSKLIRAASFRYHYCPREQMSPSSSSVRGAVYSSSGTYSGSGPHIV